MPEHMYKIAPLSTDYKAPKATQNSTDVRQQWFGATGGQGSYPNWTMGAEASVATQYRGRPRTPTSLQSVPEDKSSQRYSRRMSPGRPTSTESVRDIAGASPRCRIRTTASETNWTVPVESPRQYLHKQNFINCNVDIEGSRPALTKFSKRNQRIVPDPLPDRSSRFRSFQSHHATKWTDEGYHGSDMLTPRQIAERRQHPNMLETGQDAGCLQLKKVEFFKDGHYKTQSVVMENGAPAHSVGLAHSKGVGVPHTDITDRKETRRSSSVKTSHALLTADIEGTRKGKRLYTNKPNLCLDVSEITAARPRSVSPASGRDHGKNASLRTDDIVGAKSSPRVSTTAPHKQMSLSLQTGDITGATPRVRNPVHQGPPIGGWW